MQGRAGVVCIIKHLQGHKCHMQAPHVQLLSKPVTCKQQLRPGCADWGMVHLLWVCLGMVASAE